MKFCLPFILLFIFSGPIVFAQQTRSIRVNAGEDAAQAYSPQGFYRFPQFGKATLYFKSGNRNSSGLLFNYNLLSGAVQFINPKGDTLDLVNSHELDSVAFDKTVFVYNNGFSEMVAKSDSLYLLKKLTLSSQAESVGAYGQPNPTGSITQYQNIVGRSGVVNLIVNEHIILTEEITWFFLRRNIPAVKANKANLLKLLPVDKQAKAETYLKQNKISFGSENDLKKLLEAMQG